MGLYKHLDLPTGLSLDQAYYKINSIKTDYNAGRAWINMLVYVNKAARDAHKDPIFISDDYRVYNVPKLIQQQACYCVYVNKAAYGSGLSLTVTPSPGAPSVIVTEGINLTITALMSMDEQIQAIMNALNADSTFKANWETMYTPMMQMTQCFCIMSKGTGAYSYEKGNSLVASGSMISQCVKKMDGINTTCGDFDFYFGSKANSNDIRQQSYKYLKTLPEFTGCYDD